MQAYARVFLLSWYGVLCPSAGPLHHFLFILCCSGRCIATKWTWTSLVKMATKSESAVLSETLAMLSKHKAWLSGPVTHRCLIHFGFFCQLENADVVHRSLIPSVPPPFGIKLPRLCWRATFRWLLTITTGRPILSKACGARGIVWWPRSPSDGVRCAWQSVPPVWEWLLTGTNDDSDGHFAKSEECTAVWSCCQVLSGTSGWLSVAWGDVRDARLNLRTDGRAFARYAVRFCAFNSPKLISERRKEKKKKKKKKNKKKEK